MPANYHHMTSRYARLTTEAIDHCIEVVRDATEVLHGDPLFDAADFIIAARELLEAEQLLAEKGADLAEGDLSAFSDWTLACIAHGMEQAASGLRERGNPDMANQVRARELSALCRLAESPWRSPLVSYPDVFSTLLNESGARRSAAGLRYQLAYIVHDLDQQKGVNVLSGLRDLGWVYHLRGDRERAVEIFVKLLRHDPGNVWTHDTIAWVFAGELPELARAAAQRALELIGNEDTLRIVPQLRRCIAELAGKQDGARPANAQALLEALRLSPAEGKKVSLQRLCKAIAPETDSVVKKVRPPLPDIPTLRSLRDGLASLPRPAPRQPTPSTTPVAPARPSALKVAPPDIRAGRNDPCPCGSGQKFKKCCSVRVKAQSSF